MIEFIKSEFTKIVRKAIERHAAEKGQKPDNVQLLFLLDAAQEYRDAYRFCIDYKTSSDQLNLKQVMGVRFDLKQYSTIMPPYIQQILNVLAERHEIDLKRVFVFAAMEQYGIDLFLYNYDKFVEQLSVDDLFGLFSEQQEA